MIGNNSSADLFRSRENEKHFLVNLCTARDAMHNFHSTEELERKQF